MLESCEGAHIFGVSQARQSLGIPKLSLKQRVIGFCISLSIAAAFAVLVSVMFYTTVIYCIQDVSIDIMVSL